MTGKFIVVEGIEGAGKSSAIAIISEYLTAKQIPFILTREPGGTPMAESIRTTVKQHWEEKVSSETELLLMYAARSQLVENVIKPALENGRWVVGDRHDLSTIAYQGGGREISLETLKHLKHITMKNFAPDFTLYLDVSPEIGLSRAATRGKLDRIEVSGLDFFEKVRNMYRLQVDKLDSAEIIDATLAMEQVHENIIAALESWMR